MNWTMISLRAMLLFVLWTQISHQRISLGDSTMMNWFMAITIELSISVIASAVFSIIMGSDKQSRYFALAALPALFWCMSVSYEASVQVFTKARLDQVQNESKSLTSILSEQRAINANNALHKMSLQGISSGAAFDKATRELDAGMAQIKANENQKNDSTTALAITGGDTSDGAVNDKAISMAKQRAIMLIVLTLALSGLSGLWSGITMGWKAIRREGVTASPKQRASAK